MPRQPFLNLPQVVKSPSGMLPWFMGANPAEVRPHLASIIGECLFAWPQIDLQMAVLLSALLKTDSPAAVAVYLTLRRSSNRFGAINAAANMTLDPIENELLAATLKIVRAAEAERNALAHGYFGVSELVPDGILWASADDYVRFLTNVFSNRESTDTEWHNIATKIFVYKEADLSGVFKQISNSCDFIRKFITYVRLRNSGQHVDGQKALFDHISNLPPIQEALHRSES